MMLACDDFETEIRPGRLWFVTGDQWDIELEQLLIAQDGLPTPGQSCATTLVEAEQINGMIRRRRRFSHVRSIAGPRWCGRS